MNSGYLESVVNIGRKNGIFWAKNITYLCKELISELGTKAQVFNYQ
jgi:hypothetical protein